MAKTTKKQDYRGDYLFAMSHAPSIDQSASVLHMIPIACFAALVILVVRMHAYTRPMTQFFWTDDLDGEQITDFFSYNKMVLICVAAAIALLMALFRLTTQSLALKRTYAYIPIAAYSLFVILSYAFSDYKEFALWGWNDRFEGTIPLLCYMIMLILIINSVNTEKNIRQIIIPIAISAVLLSLLGISQAVDHDFYRTVLGQKLIVPNLALTDGSTTWQQIEAAHDAGELYLRFTFNNREIYQTVYNINYVSFYLTLLVPLYVMLFIRAARDKSAGLVKKIALGILIALLIFNLIGSQSSGGYLGIGVAFILAVGRGLAITLSSSGLNDRIGQALGSALRVMPAVGAMVMIFIVISLLTIFIPSSSGLSSAMMPIIASAVNQAGTITLSGSVTTFAAAMG